MKWLDGKKTILGSVAAGLLVIANAMGWIDVKTAEVIGGFIIAWTGVAIKLAIAKR